MKSRRIIVSVFLLFVAYTVLNAQTVVVDKEEGFPVSYASVFNQDGTFLGQTDVEGVLPDLKDSKSIKITHIAYDPLQTKVTGMGKELKMQPVQLQLSEAVIVNPKAYCIRLTGFHRNYVITNQVFEDEDPILRFYEGTGQLYIFLDKKKSCDWVDLAARDSKTGEMVEKQKRVSLSFSNNSRIESIRKSKKYDLREAEGYQQIVAKDTVIGQVVTDPDQHTIRTDIDFLFPDTVKEMNLVVMKIRITEAKENIIYRQTDEDYVSISDLLRYNSYERYWTKALGMRVEGNRFNEFYVEKAEYLTEDQYKAAMKEHKASKKEKVSMLTSEQLDQYMTDHNIPPIPEELQVALNESKKIQQAAADKKAAKKEKKEKK